MRTAKRSRFSARSTTSKGWRLSTRNEKRSCLGPSPVANPAASLTDGELLQALEQILTNPKLLSDWEQDFARGVTTRFVRSGMTRLQRWTAKKIVGKVMERLAEKHRREDLLERPARVVPAITTSPAPARAYVYVPPTLEEEVRGLSPSHFAVLETLSDGQWHRTTTKAAGTDMVNGPAAK